MKRRRAHVRLGSWGALGLLALGAAAFSREPGQALGAAPPSGQARRTSSTVSNPDYAARYDTLLESSRDLEYEGLVAAVGSASPAAKRLTFDPTQARYFPAVERALGMNAAEKQAYQTNGFVMVDHAHDLSMGQAYLDIYQADLPVFISTDSILHALHRSYDAVLQELESEMLVPSLEAALSAIAGRLKGLSANPELGDSLNDLALYCTVAQNLLAGVEPGSRATLRRAPVRGDPSGVTSILAKIGKLTADDPHGPGTQLYGGYRIVDWSQFVPRGHYTKSDKLKAYFRAMMWLGRADLGWLWTNEQGPRTAESADDDRQLRDAALLVLLADEAAQSNRLTAMSRLLDFMVGRPDTMSFEILQAALRQAQLTRASDLGSPDALVRLRKVLRNSTIATAQIRSRALFASEPRSTPHAFQLFGQRFVLDSFVLSKVVFDAITYRGTRPQRAMPSGLDVMAALGSSEAVIQLEPSIRRYNYAGNLLAARRLVDAVPSEEWQQNTYFRWLYALRQLYQPPASKNFPQSMRTSAWQRKQLQTTLASWAELRHDTILYAAQSYTTLSCEYPEGFVEPYPAFYATLAALARQASKVLSDSQLEPPRADPPSPASIRLQQGRFFDRFATTMDWLEKLSNRELAAQPFDANDKEFLKQVMQIHYGCGGPPDYSGWYPNLFYPDEPVKREPTIADVHTDPNSGSVLEAAVGDARYLVIAIDNQQQRTVYVGPVYSYYEFTSPTRLTDDAWKERIGTTPPPSFTRGFVLPAAKRQMTIAKPHRRFG